jgi:hypothetical protein
MANIHCNEIIEANNFVLNHLYDDKLLAVLREAENPKYTHKQRWVMTFDYMDDHYPGATSDLVHGLAYRAEI